MSVIRHFVRLNRKASAWIAKQFPRVFHNPTRSYRATLLDWIIHDIRNNKPRTILEAGGVDRPILDRSPHYRFIGLDIDERPECARLYDRFIVQSIEKALPEKFDMIVSFTLLEHVPNNSASIRAIYEALNSGGGLSLRPIGNASLLSSIAGHRTATPETPHPNSSTWSGGGYRLPRLFQPLYTARHDTSFSSSRLHRDTGSAILSR